MKLLAAAVWLVAALAGCSRQAQIDGDANYVIEVTNHMPHAMNVSLNLGTGLTALGSVDPHQTRRFDVRNPGTNDVELIASDQGKTHQVTKKVELSRTAAAKVQLGQ